MGFIKKVEKRAIYSRDLWGSQNFGTDTYAGKSVTQISSLQQVAVWHCVSLIADTISSRKTRTFRINAKGVDVETQPPSWLKRPNVEMTRVDFWHRVMVSLLLDGNAYIYLLRDANGFIAEAWPIHPSFITPTREGDGAPKVFLFAGQTLTERTILHITAFGMAGFIRGLSPIEQARQAIGGGMAAEEYAHRFFGQGGTASGVIQAPGTMTPDQAEVMAKSWQSSHSGTAKSHLPAVLSGGATWQTISITPEQAQFLETRRFQKVEIANLFRVAPFRLDPTVASTWGSGIEELGRHELQLTYDPWFKRLENAISDACLVNGQYLIFDTDDLVKGTFQERMTALATSVNGRIFTPNEARATEGLPPVKGGDELIPVRTPNSNVGVEPLGSTAPTPPDPNKGVPLADNTTPVTPAQT